MVESERPRGKSSRRTFIGNALKVGVGVAIGAEGYKFYSEHKPLPAYFQYNEYVDGFPQKSGEYRSRVMGSLESRFTQLQLSEEEHALKTTFIANKESLYGLHIHGVHNPNVSVQPVLVTVDNKTRLAPIVQSSGFAMSPMYLGELEGEQEVTLTTLDGENVPNLDVELREMTGDPFVREVIRHIPDLYINENNRGNPLNDVPLSSNFYLRENFFGVRMPEFFMRYSAESNTHVPYPLANEVGRIWDYDSMSLLKMNALGEKYEEAIMVKGHFIEIIGQYPEPVVLPWGERVRYQSVEKNNMVSDHIKTDLSCSFIPDEFLDLSSAMWREREIAINAVSIREYVDEGRLAADDPLVTWEIQNEWGGQNFVGQEET